MYMIVKNMLKGLEIMAIERRFRRLQVNWFSTCCRLFWVLLATASLFSGMASKSFAEMHMKNEIFIGTCSELNGIKFLDLYQDKNGGLQFVTIDKKHYYKASRNVSGMFAMMIWDSQQYAGIISDEGIIYIVDMENRTKRAVGKCNFVEATDRTGPLPENSGIADSGHIMTGYFLVPAMALADRNKSFFGYAESSEYSSPSGSSANESSQIKPQIEEVSRAGLPLLTTEESAELCKEENTESKSFQDCILRKTLGDDALGYYECGRNNTDKALVATCALKRTLNENDRRNVNIAEECYKANKRDLSAIGSCIAEQSDDPNVARAGRCLTKHIKDPGGVTFSALAVCYAADALNLNPEAQIAAECAVSSGGEPLMFAGCTGGRISAAEIDKCAKHGIGGDDGCFGPNNTIVTYLDQVGIDTKSLLNRNGAVLKFANGALTDLGEGGPGENNDIVKAQRDVSSAVSSTIERAQRDVSSTVSNTVDDGSKLVAQRVKDFMDHAEAEAQRLNQQASDSAQQAGQIAGSVITGAADAASNTGQNVVRETARVAQQVSDTATKAAQDSVRAINDAAQTTGNNLNDAKDDFDRATGLPW
jgi:hypothetical protein